MFTVGIQGIPCVKRNPVGYNELLPFLKGVFD